MTGSTGLAGLAAGAVLSTDTTIDSVAVPVVKF